VLEAKLERSILWFGSAAVFVPVGALTLGFAIGWILPGLPGFGSPD
jgi:hypothetical protein